VTVPGAPTRRDVLRAAAVAAAAGLGAGVSAAPARARHAARRRTAVFGGGVAGLSVAHELADRGFDVTVYERSHLGGKAWSVPVPGTARAGRPALRGEHGFRFFPGFYTNLGDTLRRIPVADGFVYDRLVHASAYRMSFRDRPDITAPLSMPPAGVTPDAFVQTLAAALVAAYMLPADEAGYFASKLFVYMTSCDERRLGQWDHVSWRDFVREEQMSAEYRKVVSRSLVRNLAATKSDEASTHAIGLVGSASAMSLMGRGNDEDATFDRVLDGPTSDVWLDPWVRLLTEMGVVFRVGWTLRELGIARGAVAHAVVHDGRRARRVEADWYVSAVPLERFAPLLTPAVLRADPGLEGVRRLRTDWMVGLQYYLREPLPLAHGHVNFVDSPFAITSISQAQFWAADMSAYGDGTVRECLSTIVSDWETPGIVYRRPAKQLTPDQLAEEVLAQIRSHLNGGGARVLRDDMVVRWFLDPAIRPARGGGVVNETPLFIQHPGEWADRPESVTAIPNLFLAGDWVRTDINVTTMEGANASGRRAANGVLAAAGLRGDLVAVRPLYVPPEYEPFREADRARYRSGLPNAFDPDQASPR
jgi:uncharacterized protein with NAD-binding domain and iron-sulfur cluster